LGPATRDEDHANPNENESSVYWWEKLGLENSEKEAMELSNDSATAKTEQSSILQQPPNESDYLFARAKSRRLRRETTTDIIENTAASPHPRMSASLPSPPSLPVLISAENPSRDTLDEAVLSFQLLSMWFFGF
jgi:hypothetical protein